MEITKGLSDLEVTKWSGLQSIDNLNLSQQPALNIRLRNTEAQMSRTTTSCSQGSQFFSDAGRTGNESGVQFSWGSTQQKPDFVCPVSHPHPSSLLTNVCATACLCVCAQALTSTSALSNHLKQDRSIINPSLPARCLLILILCFFYL